MSDLRDRLLALGFDPADVDGRAALVERARAAFVAETSTEPSWAWWVPGRIEVFGKHTDYAGGRSLLAAVPRGFAVVAGPRRDGLVRVLDARWQVAMDVDPGSEAPGFKGWANYVAVVARRLAHNFPGAALGTTVAFASDLPRAAGLSSSSALVVGVASALIRRAALADRSEWREAIRNRFELAGYFGAVENGLSFGTLAGVSGVGTHGGSEDHTAILNCASGRVSGYAYVPVRHLGDADVPTSWRFVVMASGIEADKAGSARARYNRASLATRALVEFWRKECGHAPGTLAALVHQSATLDELKNRLRLTRGRTASVVVDDFTAGDLLRRLDHFLAEDARIPRALDAFREGDVRAVGQLSDASQLDAETLLGNQIPETMSLARAARVAGAFAASSFGAGFGGSVWALTRAAGAQEFADEWRRQYQAAHPSIANPAWFVAPASASTAEIALTG